MMNGIVAAADIARLLADPTRLGMLQSLLRRDATVSELLTATGTTQSNLSNHIKLLREQGLIEGTRDGRQIIYRISSPVIAELVDALFTAVGSGNSEPPPTGPLAEARTCYDHLAGRLGVRLLAGLAAKEAISIPSASWTELELGPKASSVFKRLGIDLDLAMRDGTRRRFAYGCPDWSEHGDFHIGGLVGAILCQRCLDARWIKHDVSNRAVHVTTAGREALAWLIGKN
jgi:DNA-binding transcriptional ArsR family regulator